MNSFIRIWKTGAKKGLAWLLLLLLLPFMLTGCLSEEKEIRYPLSAAPGRTSTQ